MDTATNSSPWFYKRIETMSAQTWMIAISHGHFCIAINYRNMFVCCLFLGKGCFAFCVTSFLGRRTEGISSVPKMTNPDACVLRPYSYLVQHVGKTTPKHACEPILSLPIYHPTAHCMPTTLVLLIDLQPCHPQMPTKRTVHLLWQVM
jgi:hypothetical protein